MTGTEEAMALPQGDVGLLNTEIAQRLLNSTEPARMALVAADGTPRVFPMMFRWTGEEVVMATFGGAYKIAALRARPDVALTIDIGGFPPDVLLIRGRAELTDVAGIAPDYAMIQRRYQGEEAAAAVLAQVDQPGVTMVRIAVRPGWVGVLDFQTRLPSVMTRGR